MKIRRAAQKRSLRDIPIDGFDMFLLSLVEDELSLGQLTEISSRSALETVRHVLRLGRLGLLALEHDSADERLLAAGWDESAAQELLDNAQTMRPPPARASAPQAILLEAETKTGVRRRPSPHELEAPRMRDGSGKVGT